MGNVNLFIDRSKIEVVDEWILWGWSWSPLGLEW